MIKSRTLTGHLLAWALGTLVLLWATFVYLGYRAGQHEADELTDGHLATVAALLLSQENAGKSRSEGRVFAQPPESPLPLKAHDYQQSLSAVIWNQQGEVISRIGSAPALTLDVPDGFSLLRLGPEQQSWRSFARWDDGKTRRVMVLVAEGQRDALADDIAGQISEPGWWLLPLMLLALGLAIHRGLRPLRELSSEVRGLEVLHPRALAVRSRHEELRAAVDAINRLVSQYDDALVRERQLADTFAHELRTPLTALGLRVDALRQQLGEPLEPGALASLKQVEAETRRASQVLSHLLALARTSRIKLNEEAVSVDVAALARRVLAEHVPAADAAGHELGYDSEEHDGKDQPVRVQGHPVLIEMALRNLLENALAHAPAHSRIDVKVSASPPCLQVCDGPGDTAWNAGQDSPASAGQGLEVKSTRLGLGLGLGHQVILRIAEVHGGSFKEIAPPAGYRRCYRLCFA
jgi:two-component system sensor histidine kinase QseC